MWASYWVYMSLSPPCLPFRAREIGWLADAMIRVETKNFIYFYLGQIAILLWKTS